MEISKKFNKNKYLPVIPPIESRKRRKNYEELWSKIKDLIRPITKNSDHYDEKCTKVEFDWDEELPLNKTIEIFSMIIFARVVLHLNNKYYTKVFLAEFLYR